MTDVQHVDPARPRARASGALRWLALGTACVGLTACAPREAHAGSALLLLAVAHAWLCALVYVTPPRWGHPARTGAGLLLLGVLAFAVFWATFFAPRIAPAFSALVLLAPVLAGGWLWKGRADAGRDLSTINALLLPSLALSLVVLWAGLYPFDWEGEDWMVPAQRWRDMPVDNWLSFMVADMLADGRLVSPMLEEWLTSDRPPLQAGLSLLFSALIAGHAGLAYQVSSTWAQTLVLLPVAMMLATLPSRWTRGVALLVVGLSSLVFFNALFVWPKLMAATYCALYHLALFRHDPGGPGRTPAWASVAAGVAAALALLSHGGAAFALIGSTLAFLLAGRLPALVPTLRTAATAILLYAPWVLYQKLVDPPGDRLVKWHFGGRIEVTDQSLAEVLVASYADLPFQAWLAGRWLNVEAVLAGTLRFFTDSATLVGTLVDGQPGHASQPMVEASFFSTAYSLWFFGPVLAVPLLLYALARRFPVAALWPRGLPTATLLALLAWIALMYLPGSTIIHAGAYFTTLSLQLMAVLLAARVAPPLFAVLAACSVAMACALYVFDRPAAGMPGPLLYAVGATLLVAAFAAACLHSQRARAPRPSAPRGSA